jgi:hypothetical protein
VILDEAKKIYVYIVWINLIIPAISLMESNIMGQKLYDTNGTNPKIDSDIEEGYSPELLTYNDTEIFGQSEYNMADKMDKLINSDTMILVVGLAGMILLGLVFRSLCLRLSSKNSRKELMRGGLKQMAAHMDHVTRAMTNDLELPDSPKAVIRTYSNYGGEAHVHEKEDVHNREKRDSLRVQAFTNSLKQEMERRVKEEKGLSVTLDMGQFHDRER